MKIVLGGDHAGFQFKEVIKEHLNKKGVEIIDVGPFSSESADYPDFVHPACKEVLNGSAQFAILICGSGNGVAMTANKYHDIRCALCWIPELAALARGHNNANALAIPARFIDIEQAIQIVDIFLNESFEGGRHKRRVDKIIPSLTAC